MPKVRSSSWFRAGWLAMFLLPVVAYAAFSIGDRWYQSHVLGREEALLRREIAELRLQNLRLQEDLREARSDGAIERVAREELGLVKPGDHAIVLVGPTPNPTPRPSTPGTAPPASGPPRR